MDNYFMMSIRFNKSTPEDFGLISTDKPTIFMRPSDCTLWEKCSLYDFGWGKENGYRKIPALEFPELVNLILQTNSENDKYGAADQILENHTDELLELCQKILKEKSRIKQYKGFFKILQLDNPINRSSTIGKSFVKIEKDFQEWKSISKLIKKII